MKTRLLLDFVHPVVVWFTGPSSGQKQFQLEHKNNNPRGIPSIVGIGQLYLGQEEQK